MLSRDQVRTCVLYDFHSGMKAAESHRRLVRAFGDDIISKTVVYDLFNKFKAGQFEVKDQPRSGRPSALNEDELRQLVEANPRLTTREMSKALDCDHSTVVRHLAAIGKVSKINVWVPHDLKERDKLRRIEACSELLSKKRTFGWLDTLITGDEKWCLYVNATRGRTWTNVGERPQATPKPEVHQRKVMLCIWWDIHGPLHWELLPRNMTINSEVYCSQLERLADAIRTKRPQLKKVRFLHDNARPHVAKLTRQKLLDLGWEILPHPPYSPDIAPSDYHLFRSMQNFFAGKQFADDAAVKTALEEFFESKPPQFYAEGIHALPSRWKRILEYDGNYFS